MKKRVSRSLEPDTYAQEQEPGKRSLFKKRTRRPSFALSVLVNAFRLVLVFILIAGLAGLGAVVGIGKAYVETSPTLDIQKIDEQAQTSFFYDAQGNLITDYKGTENRIVVARNRYVQAVQDFNTYVRSFPQNLTAKLFSYPPKANFSVENEKAISTAPKVEFNKPTPATTN